MNNLWTSIYVKDMNESVEFYTKILGLSLDKRYTPMPGYEIAFLGKGETKFELMCNQNDLDVAFTHYSSTGFQIESVEEMLEHLKANNIKIVMEPFSPNPHLEFFFIEDPNGYRIQLVELK